MLRSIAVLLALALAAPSSAETALTLDDALGIAARESTDLAIARADARIAGADRSAAVAGVLPRLDLTSSAGRDFTGRSNEPRTFIDPDTRQEITIPFLEATSREAYALQLQLTQPLLDWRTFREIARAGWSARAAERQFDEATLTVALDVTRRFYEVVRAERTLKVLVDTVARSEELVARADALFAAGRAAKSETLTARVNLGNDRIAVERQRAVVAQARAALSQALGRGASGEVAIVAPAALDGALPAAAEPPPVDALLELALRQRPTIAAQKALVEAADAAIGGAQAGFLPTISARATYGRQGQEAVGAEAVIGDPTLAYGAAAQVVLSWNLFEGRRTQANVQRAEVSAQRARATASRAEAQVAKDIADARAAAVARGRQVALAAENLRTADQGLALARERLDAGLASQLEVRDASLKLTQAELSLLEARVDSALATAELSRAVGGSY